MDEALSSQEQGLVPDVWNNCQTHTGHMILKRGVKGVEGSENDVRVSREEQRTGGSQRMDGATGGSSNNDPPSHTHYAYILTAVDVDAGFYRTQDH